MTAKEEVENFHTIAVLVDNEPGVLARVIGLFSGRGYNIESLTVAEISHEEGFSRITIVTSGTPMIIEQIKAQLGRLVPVHNVSDLTLDGPSEIGRASWRDRGSIPLVAVSLNKKTGENYDTGPSWTNDNEP